MDNSRWLHHISGLLKSALLVVDTIDIEEKSILIHCSDGWDRTPQLVALAEIMLDPHYRTFEGFKTLIQREWLDFGHKFADRCGSNPCNEDPNERCPVFLQWLDCIQQLLVQYPRHFEFNSSYLVSPAPRMLEMCLRYKIETNMTFAPDRISSIGIPIPMCSELSLTIAPKKGFSVESMKNYPHYGHTLIHQDVDTRTKSISTTMTFSDHRIKLGTFIFGKKFTCHL